MLTFEELGPRDCRWPVAEDEMGLAFLRGADVARQAASWTSLPLLRGAHGAGLYEILCRKATR
jgi:hypothetical protein